MNKRLIPVGLTLAIGIFAIHALAGNEGPQASPPVPPPVNAKAIAEVSVSGGMPAPNAPPSTRVRILSDGSVTAIQTFMGKPQSVTALAQLSGAVLNKLVKALQSVHSGNLVDPDPTQPGCEDAPTVTYTDLLTPASAIVAQTLNCKKLTKSNYDENDATVESALEAVLSLQEISQ